MIKRNLAGPLRQLARSNPVILVTGPRQSGKTTLCRSVFPRKAYVSLELLAEQERARRDPLGFLDEYRRGAVIDEAHNVPELFSYIQVDVDRDPTPGRFILTGSRHFAIMSKVAQSLAGRVAILTLLPPSIDELRRFERPQADLMTTLWAGAYPRIHDRKLDPGTWLTNYVSTYVQRDVREILNVGNLEAFTTFLRLCAGRTANQINLSSLGSDAGVASNTVRSWLSVLEASFVIFRARAWRTSMRKQLVKAPKLHFVDSGLVCNLLNIRGPSDLAHHPLRGAIFESWVASEILKARTNRGLSAEMHHYREATGLEVDVVLDLGPELVLVEAKSGATVAEEFLRPVRRLAESVGTRRTRGVVVYGGDQRQTRGGVLVVPWNRIDGVEWD